MELFDHVYKDPEGRIKQEFKIPKYFKPSVKFWFNIYTQYDSKYTVLHDKNNLAIIYKIVLLKSKKKEHKQLKNAFSRLSKNQSGNKYTKLIINTLKKANIRIPKNKRAKNIFFNKLRKGVRGQVGQRNMIRSGLKNIQTFKPIIISLFNEFKLPLELLAIPFIESSFNLRAKSKVGATGVWQFMNRVGKYFMNINKYVDNRNNPIISTVGALHLLKQNLQVLKRWDLAVPAYNSGTKHLLRAKRRMNKRTPNLQNILKYYKHPHMGFASKNFYSEFLALVHAFAYKDKSFPLIKKNNLKKAINIENIKFYISKCSIGPMKLFSKLRKKSSMLKYLNGHIKKRSYKRYVPKGTIFVSDIVLSKKLFLQITNRNARKIYPKNWKKLVRKKSCS